MMNLKTSPIHIVIKCAVSKNISKPCMTTMMSCENNSCSFKKVFLPTCFARTSENARGTGNCGQMGSLDHPSTTTNAVDNGTGLWHQRGPIDGAKGYVPQRKDGINMKHQSAKKSPFAASATEFSPSSSIDVESSISGARTAFSEEDSFLFPSSAETLRTYNSSFANNNTSNVTTHADTVVSSISSSSVVRCGSSIRKKLYHQEDQGSDLKEDDQEAVGVLNYSPETLQLRHRCRAASLSPLRVRKLLDYSYGCPDDSIEEDGCDDQSVDSKKRDDSNTINAIGVCQSVKQRLLCRLVKTHGGNKVPSLACKMLLVGCLALSSVFSMVFVAQSRAPSYMTSRRLTARAIKKIERKNIAKRQSMFTVLLKGSRIELLQQSLDHHARCRSVKSVWVEYLDGDERSDGVPPPSLLNHGSDKVMLPSQKIKTDGVLLLDEGIIFTCNELDRAFTEWRKDPVRLVSLLPPLSPICEPFVSDAALFAHRLLVNSRPKVPSNNDRCQHLALSAHLASLSSKEPVSIVTKPFVVSDSDNNLDESVDDCIFDLKRVYGLKESART